VQLDGRRNVGCLSPTSGDVSWTVELIRRAAAAFNINEARAVNRGSITKGRLRGGGGGGRRRRRRCGGGAKSQPPPSFHLIHIAETDVA